MSSGNVTNATVVCGNITLYNHTGNVSGCNVTGFVNSGIVVNGFVNSGTVWGNLTSINKLPAADAGPDKSVYVNKGVSFTGSGTDSDGIIVSYFWGFGDGTNGTGANASHTYPAIGTYTATLTVTDNEGKFNSHPKISGDNIAYKEGIWGFGEIIAYNLNSGSSNVVSNNENLLVKVILATINLPK